MVFSSLVYFFVVVSFALGSRAHALEELWREVEWKISIVRNFQNIISRQIPVERFALEVQFHHPNHVTNQGKVLHVGVRLDSSYGREYKVALENWLDHSVSGEFGAETRVSVVDLIPFSEGLFLNVNQIRKEASNETPIPLNDSQIWLSLIFVSAFGFTGRSALRVFGRGFLRRTEFASTSDFYFDDDQSSLPNSEEIQFSQKQRAAALLVITMREHFLEAVDHWFDEGLEGKRKIAVIIDSMMVRFHGIGFVEKDPEGSATWEVPEKIRADKAFFAVCRSFGALMPLDTKADLLTSALRDLRQTQVEKTASVFVTPSKASVAANTANEPVASDETHP